MKPPTIGYIYRLQWGRREPPPEGLPAVLFEGYALSTHPAHKPPALHALLGAVGYGSGWSVYVQAITPPARRRSEAQRGAQRTRNLKRRVTTGKRQIGPLFADEVIRAELERRPGYFAGEEVSAERAAYVEAVDREDARRWAAFLAWYAEHAPKPESSPEVRRVVAPWWDETWRKSG